MLRHKFIHLKMHRAILGHTANYFDNRSWQMPNASSRKIANAKCERLRKGKCQIPGGPRGCAHMHVHVALALQARAVDLELPDRGRANTQMPNINAMASSPRSRIDIANAKCRPSKNRKCQMPAAQNPQMPNAEITGGARVAQATPI